MSRKTMTLNVPQGFHLARAVCSYGYFLLAPNRWWPLEGALDRPFRGAGSRVIRTRITQASDADQLTITAASVLSAKDKALIHEQAGRMFRLTESDAIFKGFHKVCPQAKKRGFARLFRSPTVFEDIVKTMTGCNVTWPNTMRMNKLLVEHIGHGDFPTPHELSTVDPAKLKALCKVGYRADRIIRLARETIEGSRDLARLEDTASPTETVFEDLKTIHGIGDYAAGNMCQLLGRYDRLAIDSETYRHFRMHHKIETPDNPAKLNPVIHAYYARYAPYEFLAYWFELWRFYEKRVGDAWTWDADTHGGTFTSSQIIKAKLNSKPPKATP